MGADTHGMTLKEYCIKSRRAELLQQWNNVRNKDLTPEHVACGSSQKVWWIAVWAMNGSGRSTAARRDGAATPSVGWKVLAGFNDLATTHPDLAAE